MQSSNHFGREHLRFWLIFANLKMTSYMNEIENKRAILTWERIIFAHQNVALKTTQRGSFLLKTIIFACHWKRETNRSFLDDNFRLPKHRIENNTAPIFPWEAIIFVRHQIIAIVGQNIMHVLRQLWESKYNLFRLLSCESPASRGRMSPSELEKTCERETLHKPSLVRTRPISRELDASPPINIPFLPHKQHWKMKKSAVTSPNNVACKPQKFHWKMENMMKNLSFSSSWNKLGRKK